MAGSGPAPVQATLVSLRAMRRVLVAAAVLLASYGSAAEAWVTQVAGEIGLDDPARTIARDPAGDLIAVAVAQTAKYDGSSGALLWRVEAGGATVALDHRGDVVSLAGPCCSPGQTGWGIVKRSGADGRQLWRFADQASLASPLPPLVDHNGDVVVVGAIGDDLAAVKVSGATGTRLWLARLPGIAPHRAGHAALDAHGDVAVAGYFDSQSSPSVVTKIAGSDGRRLWRTLLDAGSRLTGGIGFDAAGDVLVGGGRQLAINEPIGMLVAKLDGTSGTVRWRDLSVVGSAGAFTLDPAGGIVLAGGDGLLGGAGTDVVVARWTAHGSLVWRRVVPVDSVDYEVARHVTVVGNAVVVGGSIELGSTRSGPTVFALAADDGEDLWRLQLDGDGDLAGFKGSGTAAVVPDGDAALFVSASLADEGSRYDALLTKLAVADGHEDWRVVEQETTSDVDDVASSIAVDPHGDLIAGGILGSAASGRRVGAVKLSPSDGHEIWRTTIDGLEGIGRVAVDPAGDVLATGAMAIGPPVPVNPPFPASPAPVALAVVKIAGDDGRESWRHVHDGGEGVLDLGSTALDRLGDVLTNAWLGFGPGAQVVKIDGEQGVLEWAVSTAPRQFVVDTRPAPLVVDEADDVIAAVNTAASSSRPEPPRVVKLDGLDGATQWTFVLPSRTVVTAMAVDRQSDVLVAAGEDGPPAERVVRKLVGATGAIQWTADLGPGSSEAVAVDPSGHVLVAGRAALQASGGVDVLAVTKLDGATGHTLWEYRASAATPGVGSALVVDALGDVFVAGRIEVNGTARFAVVKLGGVPGVLRWSRTFASGGPDIDTAARDVVLDGRGSVVAGGTLFGAATGLDFAVVSLDATTGRGDGACRVPRICGGEEPRFRVPTTANGRLPRR